MLLYEFNSNINYLRNGENQIENILKYDSLKCAYKKSF